MKKLSTELSTDLSTGLDKFAGIWTFNPNKYDLPMIYNFYGMNFKPEDIYRRKRKKMIEFLGKKYLLAVPIKKLTNKLVKK